MQNVSCCAEIFDIGVLEIGTQLTPFIVDNNLAVIHHSQYVEQDFCIALNHCASYTTMMLKPYLNRNL